MSYFKKEYWQMKSLWPFLLIPCLSQQQRHTTPWLLTQLKKHALLLHCGNKLKSSIPRRSE
jgi:hypothetical protein